MRYDENWSPMLDPARRSAPLDALKAIPLNADGSWYLTLGGELRERYESSRHPVFGLRSPPKNDYLLHRALLFGDLRLGPHGRAFVELVNGLVGGWDGTPPPTQKDQLDLLQGFGELTLPAAGGEAMLRAGRQEISFGSSRLVSVREGPNVRRAFDGIRTAWTGEPGRVDVFLVRPVSPETGSFNDGSDQDQAFWGSYATGPVPGVPDLKADLYYLGLERDGARYAQGTGTEHRHTVGARLFGERAGFDWNVEGAFQFGSFGQGSIRAWTLSSNAGFTFTGLPFSPRLGLNADAISGDGDLGDDRLETFNPLFPKLPYFSEANLVAPANLLDIQPNLTLALTPAVSMNLGWNALWKQAKADAFYAPPLSPVAGTAGGDSRFIGQQASVSLEWQATEQLVFGGSYVQFTPGSATREAGGRSGNFLTAWMQFRF